MAGVLGSVVPRLKSIIVDEAYLLEGQSPDELPERPIGISRGIRYAFSELLIPIKDGMLEGSNPPTPKK